MKNLLRATCLAIVVTGVCAATPAFADGTGTTTTMVVTSKQASIVSGRLATFKAVISPNKVGKTAITGSVTWTITGNDGSSVSCTSTNKFGASGTSLCKVGTGVLVAAASPYTVTASYSGDANFAPVAESIPFTVTAATTRMTLKYGKPHDSTSTTIVATVSSGPGSAAVSGNVTFAVAASFSAKGVKPFCEGTNPSPSANNTQPLVNGKATCVLPAGWLAVQAPSTANKHPKTRWTISASYGGNTSFLPFATSRTGIATH